MSNRFSAGSLKRAAGSVIAAMEQERICLAFVVALVIGCAVYRVELATIIYSGSSPLASLQVDQVPVMAFLKTPFSDLLIISLLGFCYLGAKRRLRRRMPSLVNHSIFWAVETVLATAGLLVLVLVLRIHYQILVQLDSGLTLDLVEMSPQIMNSGRFFDMLIPQDYFFVVGCLIVFWLALAGTEVLRRIYRPVGLGLVAAILAVQCLPGAGTLPSEIAQNPIIYFFDDSMKDALLSFFNVHDVYSRPDDWPGEAQMRSIRFVDPAFVTTNQPPDAPRLAPGLTADGRRWNVLIFVLESTGADYVFDTSLGNETPMPFLQKMTRDGLYLANHHASANDSVQAAFSIFTGLYSDTAEKIFATEKIMSIPTLNRFLGGDYEYFLIHPTDPEFWFPQFLFLNNGLREFDSKKTMPPGSRKELTGTALNEIDCMDFLQTRLDKANGPFLAVYWSFVPHYPYSDYGSDFRILPDPGSNRQRYYNNLRLLDEQLRRIYEHLVKTGVADRTLFVFVGDHGEAFEQHPGVVAHGSGCYDEMYHVPMLFWQPRLIPPQVIQLPTSHVDIVPTLLDVLGVSYDASRFQGESVLRGTPVRKYIFCTDAYANYVTAINPQMNKVSICFDRDTALAFNLAKDPMEKFPLNEYNFLGQIDAILKFHNFQPQLIAAYNQAILDGHDSLYKRIPGLVTNGSPAAQTLR